MLLPPGGAGSVSMTRIATYATKVQDIAPMNRPAEDGTINRYALAQGKPAIS